MLEHFYTSTPQLILSYIILVVVVVVVVVAAVAVAVVVVSRAAITGA
jgi:hypothetical protein